MSGQPQGEVPPGFENPAEQPREELPPPQPQPEVADETTTTTTTTAVQEQPSATNNQQEDEDELAQLLDDVNTENEPEEDSATTTSAAAAAATSEAVQQYVDEQASQSQHDDIPPVLPSSSTEDDEKPKSRFPLPEGTTLESLFGPNFKPRSNPVTNSEQVPVDPLEVDIVGIIKKQFNVDDWTTLAFVNAPGEEEDQRVIDPNYLAFAEGEGAGKKAIEEELEAHIMEQEGLIARDEVANLFGDAAVKIVVEALKKGSGAEVSQVVALPRPPKATIVAEEERSKDAAVAQKDAESEESWLLHLPTIYPNRRSAHIARGPYVPGHTQVKKSSTGRAIYTPLNVLRWAFDESRDVSLSNARLVKWSSGAWTLHIGSDVYAIAADKTSTLVVVGEEVENTAAEFAPPTVKDASKIFVETAPYTRRVQLLPSAGAGQHSVEEFLVTENRISSIKNQPSNVVKLVTAPVTVNKPPVPGQPKDKNANRIDGGNEELAEYIKMQDKERERILRDNATKEGRAPTFFDRLAYDAQVLEDIRKAQTGDADDFSEMVNRFKADVAAQTATNTRNQNYAGSDADSAVAAAAADFASGSKKDKFSRRGLDNVQVDGEDGEEEEVGLFDHHQEENVANDESSKLLSSGTRRTRDGEEVGNEEEQQQAEQLQQNAPETKEQCLDRLVAMKRTPQISDEVKEEIENLYTYFADSEVSVETMNDEINKIEDRIVQGM